MTVYNLMYIYQSLFLPSLVAAFPLSIPKLLSVLLRNMDFRDGNFLNPLLQQVSKDSHRILTNLDKIPIPGPWTQGIPAESPYALCYSWRNNTCPLDDPPCQSPLSPDRLDHRHLQLDGLDDSCNQPQIRLSVFPKFLI